MFYGKISILLLVVSGLVGCFYDSDGTKERSPVSDEERQAQQEIIDKATAAFQSEDYESARDFFETALYHSYPDGRPYYLHALSNYYSVGYDQNLFTIAVEKLQYHGNDLAMIESLVRVIADNTPDLDYRKAKVDDYSRGDLVIIEGGVFQDLNPLRMKNTFSISTKYDKTWGYRTPNNEVIVSFDANPKLLKGDVVRTIAVFNGSVSMKKNNGIKVDIPSFDGYYILSIREVNL